MEANKIRAFVVASLKAMGLSQSKPQGTRLLFHDRCPVGVCFDYEGVSAIWLMAVGEIKFVDTAGNLLKVVHLLDAADGLESAA